MRERALRTVRATLIPDRQEKNKATLVWKLRPLPPPPAEGQGEGRRSGLVVNTGVGVCADGRRDRWMSMGSDQHRPIANDTMVKRNKRRFLYDG